MSELSSLNLAEARDGLLTEVARCLGEGVRRGEPVGALGEGRFGWILPDTDEVSAWAAS